MDFDSQKVLERILELVKDNGITEKECLRACKINLSFFTDWKNGKLKTPSFDKISRIADYFEVSTDYLIGRTDDPTPPGSNPKPVIPSSLDGVRFALYGDIHELDQEELEELGRMATRMRELKDLKKKNNSANGAG